MEPTEKDRTLSQMEIDPKLIEFRRIRTKRIKSEAVAMRGDLSRIHDSAEKIASLIRDNASPVSIATNPVNVSPVNLNTAG